MQSFYLLTDVLAYIDEQLENPLTQEQIAAHCFCSVSSLQKLFRYAIHLGVKEYIERRRLTQAAKALLDAGTRVTEVALRYQYQSPEVFTRAFQRLWGVTPSAFRRTWRFGGLFPRVEGLVQEGDGTMRRKVDISELYEVLRGMAGTYVLCFDIVGLLPINEISRSAGDLAIRECLKRIDAEAGEDMLLFRVGGDEFALATGEKDAAAVRKLAQRVLSLNGHAVIHEGREISVSMHAAGVRIEDRLRYAELYNAMNKAIDVAKEEETLWIDEA